MLKTFWLFIFDTSFSGLHFNDMSCEESCFSQTFSTRFFADRPYYCFPDFQSLEQLRLKLALHFLWPALATPSDPHWQLCWHCFLGRLRRNCRCFFFLLTACSRVGAFLFVIFVVLVLSFVPLIPVGSRDSISITSFNIKRTPAALA